MSIVIYNVDDGSIVAIHHQISTDATTASGQERIETELPSDASPSDYEVVDGSVVQQ